MPKQQATNEEPQELQGCLQDQMLSIKRPPPANEKSMHTDFGVGLPPLYAKVASSNPLRKQVSVGSPAITFGSRIITWTLLGKSTKAA